MAIKGSEDVLLDGIYINSTSSSSVRTSFHDFEDFWIKCKGQAPARNTDGVDTFFSNRITFRNWTVTGGDDNISLKANSTNILIQDSVFHGGLGVAIGFVVFLSKHNVWLIADRKIYRPISWSVRAHRERHRGARAMSENEVCRLYKDVDVRTFICLFDNLKF